MNFQILALFLLFFIVQNSGTLYAQNMESDLENTAASPEKFRSPSNSKIHPILIQWQLSDNPNEFAKENKLSYTENKIGVYIYLDNAESRSKIPSEITVTAFDEKITVAFVSSGQLDKLEELDFIERVTPPDLARTSSQVEIPENQIPVGNYYDYLLWFAIGGICIMTIAIFKKRRILKA